MKKLIYSLTLFSLLLIVLFFFWQDILDGYQKILFQLSGREEVDSQLLEDIKKKISKPGLIRSEEDYPQSFLEQEKIVQLVNQERRNNGLMPLKENALLNNSAQLKIEDMFQKQYFAHDSPTGEKVSDLVEKAGYDFILAGENLALGNFKDSQALVSAWMNSPGHRANILNPSYREIGVAVKQSDFEGNLTWLSVQHFATSASSCPEPDSSLRTEIQTKEGRLEEIESLLKEIEEEISAIRPKKGDLYRQKIEEYNNYVSLYNDLAKELESLIKEYNQAVNAFNQCIDNFKNN
jgi:hypothetical protein